MKHNQSIDVAIAVIGDKRGNLLITKRSLDVPHPGLWEVPGGKIEPGESPYEALVREVSEEVGIKVQAAIPLGIIGHNYPSKSVKLHVFEVTQYTGTVGLYSGQLALKWIRPESWHQYTFPEANHQVMQLLLASSYA